MIAIYLLRCVGENTNNGTENRICCETIKHQQRNRKSNFVVKLSNTVVGVFTNNCGEDMCELSLHAIPTASSQLNSDHA
jgi:hypothetical protein